jgi:[ribosomal protein S18]-alanine N-acetyltransferase
MYELTIRRMALLDVGQVMDVERQTIGPPCTIEDLVERLNQRNAVGMVAEIETGIVGYMIYELHKSIVFVSGFCVSESWRRRGVGSAMARCLMDRLDTQQRDWLDVEVSESNLPGQLFWSHFGFRAETIYRGHGDAGDAYLMRYRRGANIPANRITKACRHLWPD